MIKITKESIIESKFVWISITISDFIILNILILT